MEGGGGMSAAHEVLTLFNAGVSVRDISPLVRMDEESIREVLTRQMKRPRKVSSVTYMARVCPLFDSCRDCTFQTCELDKTRTVIE